MIERHFPHKQLAHPFLNRLTNNAVTILAEPTPLKASEVAIAETAKAGSLEAAVPYRQPAQSGSLLDPPTLAHWQRYCTSSIPDHYILVPYLTCLQLADRSNNVSFPSSYKSDTGNTNIAK